LETEDKHIRVLKKCPGLCWRYGEPNRLMQQSILMHSKETVVEEI
jgi:hypothetical protein